MSLTFILSLPLILLLGLLTYGIYHKFIRLTIITTLCIIVYVGSVFGLFYMFASKM